MKSKVAQLQLSGRQLKAGNIASCAQDMKPKILLCYFLIRRYQAKAGLKPRDTSQSLCQNSPVEWIKTVRGYE